MATTIKGLCKGLKYISQIFVVKEREMEIGYPTDVKHVAHIGWDGHSGSAPSWMNDFKAPPDFSTTTVANPRDSNSVTFSPWSSQDFDDHSTGHKTMPNMFNDIPPSDLPNVPKKPKTRKKKTSSSSPKSSSSTSRISRKTKQKSMQYEIELTPEVQVQ